MYERFKPSHPICEERDLMDIQFCDCGSIMEYTEGRLKCRKCGKEAAADLFKLHYAHKMMVCPDCFTGRTDIKKTQEIKYYSCFIP